MANEKRFIFGSLNDWGGKSTNGSLTANEEKFYNSIVFINNDTDTTKGMMIYTHGAYFEMSNESDVENIIKNYLAGKGNITVGTEEVVVDGKPVAKLVISEKSTDSISDQYTVEDGKAILSVDGSDTKLVQVRAVADALTTPMSLSATVDDSYKPEGSDKTYTTATFTQNFTNLKGEDVYTPSTVLVQGENVTFTEIESVGVEIKATDTHYNVSTSDVYTDATQTTTEGVSVDLLSSTSNNFTNADEYDVKGSIEFVQGKDIKITRGTGEDANKITIESTYVTPEETVYEGENAIVIGDKKDADGELTGDKIVSLKIADGEKILSQDTNGLKTTLTINYDSESNKVQLLGLTGADNKAQVVSEFDASAFVKDSFLVNAELVGEKPAETEGGEPIKGQYLKFTFNVVEQDDQTLVSTKDVYIEASTFFHETEGDSTTYSVVEFNSEKGAYTVKNTLGTISRDNDKNTITVSKAGLATVGDIKAVIETIDSNLDAVKAESADTNEIAVVTGITQTDGKITAVDSGLAATKTYVDNKVSGAEGEIALTSTNGIYDFAAVEKKDGYVKASQLADVLDAAWAWGSIKTVTE